MTVREGAFTGGAGDLSGGGPGLIAEVRQTVGDGWARAARAFGWPGRPAWEVLLGVATLVPALIFLGTSYLGPTLWTLRTALRQVPATPAPGLPPLSAGAESGIGVAVDAGFFDSVGYAASLLGLPLLAAVAVGPVLAWCGHRAGTPGRVLASAGLALPAAVASPAAIAAAWRAARDGDLASDAAPAAVRTAYGMGTFAVACAMATLLALAALRRREPGATPWRALAVATTVAAVATVAATMQEFTYPFVLTGGGPGHRTTTPLLAVFTTGLSDGAVARAAGGAVILTGMLALLGVGVTVLLIRTGARLELDTTLQTGDARVGWDAPRVLAAIATKVLVTIVLVITAYTVVPWLTALRAATPAPPSGASASQLLVDTWLPSLAGTVVAVGAAAAAGYGIGALRPLGRHSELLLLPFAPFLFVGVGPLALPAYVAGLTADRFDTIVGLLPPTRLAVPALFVFALLARGQAVRAELARRDGRQPLTRVRLRPMLPMVAVVAAVCWVNTAQDLLWPVLSGSGRWATGPVRLYQVVSGGAVTDPPPVALAVPGWLAVVLPVLAVTAVVGYLGRVAFRLGGEGESGA